VAERLSFLFIVIKFLSWARSESNRDDAQSMRELQSRLGPRQSARPKTRRAAEGFPRAAPDRLGMSA
jgi:hypothetical protein